VIAYADGACSGNPGPAGLGVVLIDGQRRVELSEYLGEGTNNIAELTAVLRALAEIPQDRALMIYTDSQYTIGVVQKGWKAKANQALVAELRAALSGRPATRLAYVPGHAGVLLNERADALAREAVSARKTRREVYEPKEPKPNPEAG
jgi:ribonuclease HI